jgi:hypothetical protein
MKWHDIYCHDGEDEGPLNCALCVLYSQIGCRGCPVLEVTGKQACNGSPYDNWFKLQSRYRYVLEDYEIPRIAWTDELAEIAKAERDFLLGLLPIRGDSWIYYNFVDGEEWNFLHEMHQEGVL